MLNANMSGNSKFQQSGDPKPSYSSQDLSSVTAFDKCPHCFRYFDFLRRNNVSKVPLIINCKHVFCEECIRQLIVQNTIVCPICNEKSIVPRTHLKKLDEIFSPHFSLIGYLVWSRNISNDVKINWSDSSKNKSNVLEKMEICSSTLKFDLCMEHQESYANIYCTSCDEIVCSFCFLEEHVNHTPQYLYKLGPEEMKELETFHKRALYLLDQLKTSQQKLQKLKNLDVKDVEKHIRFHFTDLHGKLHLAEKSVLKQLGTMQVIETNDNVIDINSDINTSIARVQDILYWYNQLNNKELNIRALYEDMKALEHLPCLFELEGEQFPITFKSLLNLDGVEDLFSLEQCAQMDFNLLPIENWDNIELTNQSVGNSSDDLSVSDRGQRMSVNQGGLLRITSNVSETDEFGDIGKKYRIIVTHLNDFNSFFVQKKSVLPALHDLTQSITKRSKRDVKLIVIGNVYSVLYKIKNNSHWRRGLIKSLTETNEEVVYNVFYIDYGNTQSVTKDRIKQLDLQIRKRPPFAIECKLTNPDGKLIENSHLRIIQMIASKELSIKVVQTNENGVYEVDLFIKQSDGFDMSITNLLNNDQTVLPIMKGNLLSQTKLFPNSTSFTIGQVEDVIICHINNPFDVFIQLNKNMGALKKMKNELSNNFENSSSNCIPIENTDVIVHYEDKMHGQWHRATIKKVINQTKLADVYFVDWGGTATVQWVDIHMISENFRVIECQAINISLTDIQPKDDNLGWSEDAISFLKNLALNQNIFRMVVSSVSPLKVILFQKNSTSEAPTADICINAMLVDHNYAISTGNASQTVCWPIEESVEPIEIDDNDFATQMIKKAETVLINSAECEEKLKPLQQQVDVVRYDNPNLIYVKFVKDRDKAYNLSKELYIHYQSETERKRKRKWKKHEICVCYDLTLNKYFRGSIQERGDRNSYYVYLYDVARTLLVPSDQIFIYHSYFDNYGCLIYKCYLTNVKPAGGTGSWSQLANELLGKVFTMYKSIYIRKLEGQGKVWGVDMTYTYTTIGNALEFPRAIQISINQILIESGLAFGTNKIETVPNNYKIDTDEVEIVPNNNKISEEVITIEDSASDNDMEVVVENEIKRKPINSWLPTMPVQKLKFKAHVTCIDNTGRFFTRDEEMQRFYLDLEANLTQSFSNTSLPSNNVQWQKDDICTIKYKDKWYRGIVLEVIDPFNISVEMIDFGSEHIVQPKNLSKCLMYDDVPPLVYKMRMFDVHPKFGQWTLEYTEILLDVITDNVTIEVQNTNELSEIIPVEIYLASGQNLNNLAVRLCPDLIRLRKEVDSSNENEQYTLIENEDITEPTTFRSVFENLSKNTKIYLINALKHDLIVLSNTNEGTAIDSKCLSISEEFFKEIQTTSDCLEPLENFKVNAPCVVLHLKTKTWCRALLHNIDSYEVGYAVVFFVDYGIIDVCKLENIRTIPPEWLQEPVNNVIAQLNVELLRDDKAEIINLHLNQFSGEAVKLDVVRKDPFTVNVFNCDGSLLYENLVNCGYLKKL